MGTKPKQAPLIVVVGQTASGKSALALELATCYNGEIICADSRTVYKGMDIGTAKPSHADQNKVSHHLLDIITPDMAFNVGSFKERANKTIIEINSRGKIPILVGGTGLYINSVVFDYAFNLGTTEKDDINPRHLKESNSAKTPAALRDNTLVLGMATSKEDLDHRIEHRIEAMLKNGLEQEVKTLAEQYGWEAEAMTGVGYREWQPYFAGQQTLEETKKLIITHTRQYAKRQRTWFKRNSHIEWITSNQVVHQIVKQFLQQNKEANPL